MNRGTVKATTWHVRPAKTQISLRIRAVWSESSLGALKVAKIPMIQLVIRWLARYFCRSGSNLASVASDNIV